MPHPALRVYLCTATQRKCFIDAYLAPEDNTVFQGGGTGNGHLRCKQTVLPHHYIMSDMYLVVHLGSCADHRIAAHATVDGTACTNFHIILDYYTAAAQHFFI